MKKYTIISLLAIVFGITYFVVRANAMPQAAKHELMSITYSPAAQEIEISTEYGNHEIVKTEKAKSSFNLCPVLAKVKEYENQGWSLKSVNMSPYVVMYTLEK